MLVTDLNDNQKKKNYKNNNNIRTKRVKLDFVHEKIPKSASSR